MTLQVWKQKEWPVPGQPRYGSPTTSSFKSKMKMLLNELNDFGKVPETKEVKIK